MQSTTPELTLYYDGQCPLCQAEMAFLQTRNSAGRLAFVDITQTDFVPSSQPFSCEAAMAQIHGRLSNGDVLVGVPVFSKAYALADLPVLSWLLSRRWLQPLLQAGYRWFAKHRHAISRRIGPGALWFVKRFYR